MKFRTLALSMLTVGVIAFGSQAAQANEFIQANMQVQETDSLNIEKQVRKECRDQYHLWVFGKTLRLIEECVQSTLDPAQVEDSQG